MTLTLKKSNAIKDAPSGAGLRLERKDFLSILDMRPVELSGCLDLAARLKRERRMGRSAPTASVLAGAHIALLFEKPSLRTRSTFEIAIRELGGEVIEPEAGATFGGRETPADVARNLERWVSGAVYRTFAQSRIREFAAAATRLHVVNALSDEEHPCQALADLLTLRERLGTLRGRTIAFVGDGNNVATSLAHASVILGLSVNVASPEGFGLPERVAAECARVAQCGARVRLMRDPVAAVQGASAIYTDTWTSMGHEEEAAHRCTIFEPYQVNAALMSGAADGALFMHCLPAHRGEEVTGDVIDSASSVVFDQAENRLHAQKALLLMLMGSAC